LNKELTIYDTAIIGAGCAGLGAAMYCGRFDMKTLVLGEVVGGTIITTDIVENYPGFISLTGIELAEKLKQHSLSYPSVKIKEERVTNISKKNSCFELKTEDAIYHSKTVIFSTGTEIRKLNVPGEKEFANKGVHYCALCDGAFYKDKVIAVVGGSDSAGKEALLLTQYAKKVYIIYRGENIRPEPINYKRIMENKKIEIIPLTNVLKINGDKTVNSVVLDSAYNGSNDLKLNGVFIEIGHIPLTQLAKEIGVSLNEKDEIIIDRESKTNISGVFAAGDCVDTRFKQAITGVGEAVSASYSAYQYLKG
ncbi:MAG: FAD-dependent oxidoreductase, partial [Nanoarchaeota archaeon]